MGTLPQLVDHPCRICHRLLQRLHAAQGLADYLAAIMGSLPCHLCLLHALFDILVNILHASRQPFQGCHRGINGLQLTCCRLSHTCNRPGRLGACLSRLLRDICQLPCMACHLVSRCLHMLNQLVHGALHRFQCPCHSSQLVAAAPVQMLQI